MTWIDQIVDVTGWHGESDEASWDREEAELGVALPSDFKELCRRFSAGAFYAYLGLLRPDIDTRSHGLLRWHRDSLDRSSTSLYEPYGLFHPDGRPGLILWGMDQTDGEYYWLADRDVNPDQWPVLARKDTADPWHQFDMSTAEVVYRMIADPEFKPFTVANPPRRPFYLPAGQDISNAEEWNALTDPNRDN